MRVLGGDIGGTTTRLGLFEVEANGLDLIAEQTFSSPDYPGLEEVVSEFLAGRAGTGLVACFGIAGPVAGRRMRTTNLPWVVDADLVEERAGIAKVTILNDLEATAWGLPLVGDEDLRVLNPGREGAAGNGAVIAAGTGLGEAGVYWDGERYHPFACEGGHASFAPTDELTDGLARFLREKYGGVSWERVVSGPGLADLYRFMLEREGRPQPAWFSEAVESGDPAAALSKAGIEGRCEVCADALKLFARLYGEEAGNLALKLMAAGGVWVAGGVAPKILPALESGAFMEGFLAKGRMRPLLEAMPVRVVLDERTALLGAASRAEFSILNSQF
ncbi:MAG: glucokinase [Thermoanaerobaculales bacterium]